MATRTISTKLAIEGESTYRAALKNCNTELKTLRSELGLTEEKYKTSANTLTALENKVKALTDVYQKQGEKVETLERALGNARDAYDRYSRQVEEARENVQRCQNALEDLRNTAGDTSEEQKHLTEELEKYSAELNTAEEYQAAAKRGMESWQTQLNAAKTEELRLNEELKKNKQYLQEAADSTDQCARSIDEYGNEVKGAGDDSRLFGERSKAAIDKLASALAAAGIARSVEEIAKVLRDCVDAAVDFESAMAGVSKTTDLSDQELADMSADIQEMATRLPATVTEIAAVVEAAGQLGIAKGDLLSFAEVMVNLGTSTNLASEEAASALAKFANVVKMQPENYERLGSTVVDLGNNFATTEADIVSMATRLASTGEIVGLSEPQIMAVAAALSSVGIEAEAGGSAVSKLLKQMETAVQTYGKAKETVDATGYSLRELELMASNDSAAFKGVASEMELTTAELKKYMSSMSDLQNFADVSGMAAQDFIKAWGTDAVGALGKFITGLGEIDAAGGSSVAVLQEMGITEIRLSNAVQSLASSQGILERALNTANNAWNENSALAKEAATRYETTESRLQMTKNAANNLKIAVGNELLPALGDLADSGTTAFQWAADFVEKNPWVVSAITGLVTALGALAIGVAGLAAAPAVIGALHTALGLLSANPIILVASAAAGLAASVGLLISNSEKAGPKLNELTKAAQDMEDVMGSARSGFSDTAAEILATANMAERYISRLEEMGDYSKLNNEQQEEYRRILALLTEAVPELAGQIDIQNGYIEGGTDALRKNMDAWKENAKAQAFQEELTKIYKSQADVMLEAEKNRLRLTEAETKAREAEEQAMAAEERMTEIRRKAKALADELNEANGNYASTWQSVLWMLGDEAEEYGRLNESQAQYLTVRNQAIEEAETYRQAIDADSKAVEEAQTVIDEAEQAVKNLTGAVEGGTEAQEKSARATEDLISPNEDLIAVIAELEEQYISTAEEARKSIQSQIDYFGELDEKGETSIQNIIKNMAAQAEAMESYADNITLAMERGVDQGIIQKLSDGSEESARILSAIVAGTEEQIDELNTAFARVEEGTTYFGNAVAEAERQYSMKMQEIEEDTVAMVRGMDQSEKARESAKNTVDGYISGIDDMEDTLTSRMKKLAQSANKAYQVALDINSPSKVFAENGRYTVEGAIEGAEEKQEDLEKTYAELARKAVEAYVAALPPEEKLPGVVEMPSARSNRVAYDMETVLQKLGKLSYGTASGAVPIDPEILAAAVAKALDGVGVLISGRKVGQIFTRRQENDVRARGINPVPV